MKKVKETSECARTACSVAAVTDLLFGPQRENADRATRVQPAVPVVCGNGDGREGLESRGVQQESGAVVERRDRGGIFSTGARTSQAVYVGRTFHGGWNVD